MKNLFRATMISAILLAGGSLFAAQISLRIGPPPAARVERHRPLSPGADYIWVNGYWYPYNGRYQWHEGYWTRPPYTGARWVGPRYDRDRFYDGYWEGEHGRIAHNHRWDRDRDRDYRRDRDRDRDRDRGQ